MEVAEYILPGQRYIVVDDSITYNGAIYAVGDEFTGVDVSAYTGNGHASEIIEFREAAIEAYLHSEIVFPEQLQLHEASLEIVQPENGTIYPEQLQLHGSAIEARELKMSGNVKIIYAKN